MPIENSYLLIPVLSVAFTNTCPGMLGPNQSTSSLSSVTELILGLSKSIVTPSEVTAEVSPKLFFPRMLIKYVELFDKFKPVTVTVVSKPITVHPLMSVR